MSIYYKFKSAKDYDSIAIDGHFIPVGTLKEKIFETKHLGRGTDFDLVITNSGTNEEYLDEAALIPKNTSVLIRRVPGRPRMPIVTEPVIAQEEQNMEPYKSDDVPVTKSTLQGNDSSANGYPDDLDWDEFGSDLYTIPEVRPLQSSNPVQEVALPSIDDEDSKIKALIDTPALDWQSQSSDGFGGGRGFGRGMGGRMMAGRGFGGRGGGGFERKTPPQGYICHRCKVPGHFIQHCPTNGDPNFDIRRVKPPTGIPKSMLMATPDGSYALPSGAVAVLKPNEAAFEKEIEGMPSTRSVGDLPPELHCPLCKEVMKDAVLTSKCCFTSFCDKCIRDFIISKSMCTCGASNVLADDLLPNKTLRDTINRILESNNDSAENAGSAFQVQDMESKIPQVKEPKEAPSPTASATSKGQQLPAPVNNVMPKKVPDTGGASQMNLEQGVAGKVPDKTDAVHDSLSMKEPASQGSAPLADEEVQQKPASSDAGKKKKKKKSRLPLNGADMQWKGPQDPFGVPENYMMPMNPGPYNPYWNGMQPGLDGYGAPFGGPMPYMGYGLGPLDVPFGVMPQDPFGAPAYMMPPVPPQRDLAGFGMGFNPGPPPPIMSREEFEARKADLRRKREFERRGERELPKDRDLGREVSSNGDGSSLRPKQHKSTPEQQPSNGDPHRHRRRSERSSPERSSRDPDLPRPPSKRKSEHSELDHGRKPDRGYDHGRKSDYDDYDHDYDHRERERDGQHRHRHRSESSSAAVKSSSASLDPPPPAKSSLDKKSKPSVFSRISFPAEEQKEGSKKRKISSSSSEPAPGGGGSSVHHSHRSSANGYSEEQKSTAVKAASVSRKTASVDYESSDDDRHFKRRPSRYESSPAPASDAEEEGRHHSRGSRDRKHR